MYLKKVSPKLAWIGRPVGATNQGTHAEFCPAAAATSAPTGHPGKKSAPLAPTGTYPRAIPPNWPRVKPAGAAGAPAAAWRTAGGRNPAPARVAEAAALHSAGGVALVVDGVGTRAQFPAA